MSELITIRDNQATIRWKLLTSVSAAALLVSAYGAAEAQAASSDGDRPPLWIELGGQFESLTNAQDALSPPFMASFTRPSLLSALNVQRPPAFAIAEEGAISFQPDGSDWVFSASIRYGRSAINRHHHHQTANAIVPVNIPFPAPFSAFGKYYSAYPSDHVRFADGKSNQSTQHAILDFQVGKDVGLGMFGNHASSTLSAGIRIAQFTSKESLSLSGIPDLQYPSSPIVGTFATAAPKLLAFRYAHIHFHAYSASLSAQRSFHGLGPSLSWNASVPMMGNADSMELSLDWGANAALLFGRQKAKGRHQTAVHSYYGTHWVATQNAPGKVKLGRFENASISYHSQDQYTPGDIPHHTNAAAFNRSRSVTVPNLGGFAGVSFRYANAKVSFGYRADYFFGAMDGGIDIAQKKNQGIYGPYASISVGLGD